VVHGLSPASGARRNSGARTLAVRVSSVNYEHARDWIGGPSYRTSKSVFAAERFPVPTLP
jgi:hypothetical protein